MTGTAGSSTRGSTTTAKYVEHTGYITDIMNSLAVEFIARKHNRPWSLFLAHKAVHPDAQQAADGTLDMTRFGGYVAAERHKDLYRDAVFPKKPNMLSLAEVAKAKPAWAEAFELKANKSLAYRSGSDRGRHSGGNPSTRAHDGIGG